MKLSKKLAAAIEHYYFNRSKAQRGIKWDKATDLDTIAAATPKGVSFSAAAGTFFFTWRTPKGKKRSWEVSENTYPTGTLIREK